MKILYIGPYRDGTGYGHAAVDYISALYDVGVDLVIRPLKLNDNNQVQLPSFFGELERKSLSGCNICVQHCLPCHMEYVGGMKNVAMFATETDNFIKSGWSKYVNSMDAWITFTNECAQSVVNSLINKTGYVLPHACKVEKYTETYKKLAFMERFEDKKVVYWIGEFNRRKNLSALIKAFHLAFKKFDDVELVIKTNGSASQIGEFCNEIKRGLNIYSSIEHYKPEYIITDKLTEEEMCSLHQHADIFVSTSYGEAWNIPAFDAACFGKICILPDYGQYKNWKAKAKIFNYSVSSDFGFGLDNGNLYSAYEKVMVPNIYNLTYQLITAYQDKNNARIGLELAYEHSYQEVGNKFKSILKKVLDEV